MAVAITHMELARSFLMTYIMLPQLVEHLAFMQNNAENTVGVDMTGVPTESLAAISQWMVETGVGIVYSRGDMPDEGRDEFIAKTLQGYFNVARNPETGFQGVMLGDIKLWECDDQERAHLERNNLCEALARTIVGWQTNLTFA